MLAVTFQEPGRVAVEERPEPELIARDDAVVRVDASGICGSDLHIFHGRIEMEQGFTIGHEYVGTVLAAGDVMGTGYHAIVSADLAPGDTCAVVGLGPVGLCATMAARVAGASRVIAIDVVPERLEMARLLGAEPVHLTDEDPRAAVKVATEGRGVDVAVEAVGNEKALDLAVRLTRKAGTVSVVGVYAERAQVHMGLVWIKNLTIVGGQANVMGHLDSVLSLMAAGRLDPTPLVTHHMKLADAQEAYDAYAAHQALKIVLSA